MSKNPYPFRPNTNEVEIREDLHLARYRCSLAAGSQTARAEGPCWRAHPPLDAAFIGPLQEPSWHWSRSKNWFPTHQPLTQAPPTCKGMPVSANPVSQAAATRQPEAGVAHYPGSVSSDGQREDLRQITSPNTACPQGKGITRSIFFWRLSPGTAFGSSRKWIIS